jgi:[ribosomal protein S5]-alanine N-acetyltransferase
VTKGAPLELHTQRLVLRPPRVEDAHAMFARYAGDAAVTRYVGWPRHRSIEDTRGFLAFSDASWRRWPAGPYVIHSRADGALLGSTGLAFEREGEAMTGYVLAADSWGRGYATEALGAMVDLSRNLRLRRLYAFCHPQHRASARVLEKCGFTRDAAWSTLHEFPNLAPGVPQQVACYELLLLRSAGRAT